MLNFILQCFYFMLPAYIANIVPVFLESKLKFLAIPLDFNKELNGKGILGNHKTLRGLIFGVIFSIIIVFIQSRLYSIGYIKSISLIKYSDYNFALIGFLLGFGALFGDITKSFIKRRLNIKPGESFFPWDQLDYILGAIVFALFIYIPSIKVIITIILMSFILHLLAKYIGYYIGIGKTRF